MPIKGLSDRPRLPRLGKIHLGIKIEPEGKSSYPRPTDYFVCPSEVKAVFGEQPKDLRIAFPTEDTDQWASHWYRAYSSYRGLVCRGDGEVANRLVDVDKVVNKETGALPDGKHPKLWHIASRDTTKTAYYEIECLGPACPQYQAKQCRQVMNLQFLLPDVPGLGIYQLDTSSWNSIRNVLSGIALIKGLVGRVSAMPLTLSLTPLEVTPEGQGKKTVHVLLLTAPYKVADLYRYAALPPGQAFILPAPDLEPSEDLMPDEEPTAPPAEASIQSFFLPDESEHRTGAWEGIKKILHSGSVRPQQVVAWLKREADIDIVADSLQQKEPPALIPTSTLTRLHDALGQYQMTLPSDTP